MSGSLSHRGLFLLFGSILGLIISVGPANALIIDDFTGVDYPPTMNASPAPTLWTGSSTHWAIQWAPTDPGAAPINVHGNIAEGHPSSVVSGGSRETFVAASNVSYGHNFSVYLNAVSGLLTSNQDTGVIGGVSGEQGYEETLSLKYTGFSSPLDLSGYEFLNLAFTSVDHDTDVHITLDDGPTDQTIDYPLEENESPQVLKIPLSDFNLVDLANLMAVMVSIDGGTVNLDFELDSIYVTDGRAPEPFALGIWILGSLGALGMVRVCRNRRETATV
ncbi:MAG: hypothetical protein JXB10_02560 [Pirellulales bacterium]|nr:hypothetical protein [Pirellulales bacterium]